jgi:hypothetical protein
VREAVGKVQVRRGLTRASRGSAREGALELFVGAACILRALAMLSPSMPQFSREHVRGKIALREEPETLC